METITPQNLGKGVDANGNFVPVDPEKAIVPAEPTRAIESANRSEIVEQPKRIFKPTPETKQRIGRFYDTRFPLSPKGRPSDLAFYQATGELELSDINDIKDEQLEQAAVIAEAKYNTFRKGTAQARENYGPDYKAHLMDAAGRYAEQESQRDKAA